MKAYPDKTALVCCNGLFCEIAIRLARDFKKVYLYVPCSGSFPTMNCGEVGSGFEGVERVYELVGPHFEEVDLFVFPDLYHGETQIALERMGKRVWGSRRGEEMEIYREVCKELMVTVDLPVQPWKKVVGMEALRAHLKAHPAQHVKIDRWRGNFETFFSENYNLVETKLNAIAHEMGAFQHVAEFIVEDDLPDRVEIGLDCYCIDGDYPTKTLSGIEVKDLGYVAEFIDWSKIPEPLRRFNEKMAPYMEAYGYRGFLSTEVRIGKDHVPYMIDACCRAGSPPSELYQEFYTNFAQIIWEGSAGLCVDPVPAGKYGVEVIMKSSWAEANWQPVEIDPKIRNLVKLYNPVCVEGKLYVVPQDDQMSEIGAVIGYGDTLEEALEHVAQVAEGVKGYGIKIQMGSMDQAQKEIEELSKLGIKLFSGVKSA